MMSSGLERNDVTPVISVGH